MAQILSFRTPELRDAGTTGRREGSSAEVIVFPGVRYERWGKQDGSSSVDTHTAGGDVIELADQ
jgi:hypothetical protein